MPADDCASNPHPRGAGPADYRHPRGRRVLHRLALVHGTGLRAGVSSIIDRPDRRHCRDRCCGVCAARGQSAVGAAVAPATAVHDRDPARTANDHDGPLEHPSARVGDRRPGGAPHRHLCRRPMGDMAVLSERHPVRQDRPDPRTRHRLLRLHAAVPRDAPGSRLLCCFSDGGRRAGGLCLRGRSRPGRDTRCVRVAPRDAPPGLARRGHAAGPGVWRLASNPAAPHDILRRRHRGDVFGRPCTDAGAVGTGRGGATERGARRLAGVDGGPAVADRSGRRTVLPGVDRRQRLCRDHSAFRRRAQRAGQGDAVHRPQHPGDAFGVRPRRGCRTAAVRRSAPDAGRSRAQCRDHRQRAAVERSSLARHVRADPGDQDLLRFPRRRQRPLHDQRSVPVRSCCRRAS